MPERNSLLCLSSDRFAIFAIAVLATVTSLLLIANPGFFSHDELQKVDHVLRYGFSDYVNRYVVITRGEQFGVPVRPVSFLIQGLVSLFLPSYPVLVHLVDVLMHAVAASLLFVLVHRLFRDRALSWTAALLFLMSPLVTFSVGWPAALMDRLYIIFGLYAAIQVNGYITRQANGMALCSVFVASTLAILSKETALILPFVLSLYIVRDWSNLKSRRLYVAGFTWFLPVLLFLAYRAPALVASFNGASASPYAASLMNVPQGLLVYFAYPFMPFLQEAGNWVFASPNSITLAIAIHGLLVVALWFAYGWRAACAYVMGYLFFIVPILPISIRGAHYLYGSGLILSLGLAAVLVRAYRSRWNAVLLVALIMVGVTIFHTYRNQVFIYEIGSCMRTAMESAEAAYLASARPSEMRVAPLPGAPAHILYRFSTGREQLGPYFPVKVEVDAASDNSAARFVFDSGCLIYQRN